jgi:hypothetical protein
MLAVGFEVGVVGVAVGVGVGVAVGAAAGSAVGAVGHPSDVHVCSRDTCRKGGRGREERVSIC